MPQATLTFTLPEDHGQHRCAIHGALYRGTLKDIEQYICQVLEHKTRKPASPEDVARDILAIIVFSLSHATDAR